MEEKYKRIIEQMNKWAKEGVWGEGALLASKEYDSMPHDISRLTKFIRELFLEISSAETIENEVLFGFWQVLVVVYRECKKVDSEVADAFLNSFHADFPEMPNTALTMRFNSLSRAIFAFKSVAYSDDSLLILQQATRLFLDYSEFLNGLLGYLTIAWKCAQNMKFKPNFLNANYGVKVDQFKELTDGENGVFYLFHRIAKPKLRNGIAHGNYWFDEDESKIRYTDGKTEEEHEIDITDFLGFCMVGSQLAKSYFAALVTIVIWEYGTKTQKASLPKHFSDLLSL